MRRGPRRLLAAPNCKYDDQMARLAKFVSGRRTKWLVPVLWLLLVAGVAPLGSKLQDELTDDTESFLPGSAESTDVVRLLGNRFDNGKSANGLVIYQRRGGLTEADKSKIEQDGGRAGRDLGVIAKPVTPFAPNAPPELVSEDGSLAYSIFTFPDDFDKLGKTGEKLRDIAHSNERGMNVYVTGDAGVFADFEEVFNEVDKKLLIATVLLVLVLLGAIYRSPLIALTPLIVVGLAYAIANGFIYLYAKSGATVNSNATQILVVLMFGVGTDYCLLLVSRYREELRRVQDKHEAMFHALSRSGPAILASGLTVALTMLTLAFAETGSIKALGPAAAIGVTCVMLAGLTLLPALLTIFGRNGFWPRRQMVAYDPDHHIEERTGVWRKVGDRVLTRPAAALAVCVVVFGAGSLGLLAYKEDYSTTNFFKERVESIDGFRVLESAFPAGETNPTTVLVERTNGKVTDSDLGSVEVRARTVPGVAAVRREPGRSRDGRIGRLSVIFQEDPYQDSALKRIPKLRAEVHDTEPGVRTLVGGGTAVQYDFDAATQRDLKLIVPFGLLLIAVILGILLRAAVAPLVLVGSVVASFFGTLGLSLLFFRYVVGDPGVDASLPVFAFIFLVALGVDYTIFLMSRVREEARLHGTREGVLRALSATGPVITSAGIILAGTFSVLMTLPVTFAFNIGFMVAVGILLDTFIVRTVMVPAAVELIGDRIWWPSTAKGGGGALREESHPDAVSALH